MSLAYHEPETWKKDKEADQKELERPGAGYLSMQASHTYNGKEGEHEGNHVRDTTFNLWRL
jgi:hypothetical protein